MDIFLLYLWAQLDAIRIVLIICLIATVALSLITGISGYVDKAPAAQRMFKVAFPLFLVFVVFMMLVPSRQNVAFIVAGTVTYRAATSERGSALTAAFADYVEREALRVLKSEEEGKK